jgi:hypothetical protein
VVRIGGHAYGCALSYEDVVRAINVAEARRSHVVELPIDWTVGAEGQHRNSLVGLNAIVWAKSNPEVL